MERVVLWICLLACIARNTWAIPRLGEHNQRLRLWNRILVDDLSKFDLDPDPKATMDYVVQPLSHFDPMVNVTFKQLYWIIDKYWQSPSHPVFLYIGGETPLSEGEVANGHHIEMAKTHGALVLGVEHRFYGNSTTPDNLNISQLQYLSTQEELADLANFHDMAKIKFKLTNNTWLVFGGSYAGVLSSWFRMKFPHIVYGSVASSAPVQAQVNFEGYNDVVAASLANPVVLGSKQCVGNTTQAFTKITQMIQGGQLEQLHKDFNTCQDLTNTMDLKTFVSTIAGNFMGSVQYNRVEGNQSSIGNVCNSIMGADPYQNLVKMSMGPPGQCMNVSYNDNLKELKNLYPQWPYQTCTQLGYYQTCDKNTSCIFNSMMDVAFDLSACSGAFNIPPSTVYERIDFTNTYYGSVNPRSANVVFVNGMIDPWHALGVLKDQPQNLQAVFMKSTSHCEDMQPPSSYDNDELKNGRKAIESIVDGWLKQSEMEKRRTSKGQPT